LTWDGGARRLNYSSVIHWRNSKLEEAFSPKEQAEEEATEIESPGVQEQGMDTAGSSTPGEGGREPMEWVPHSTLILGPSPESNQAYALLESHGEAFVSWEGAEFYRPRLRLPDGRLLRGLVQIREYVERKSRGEEQD
jgi:hypothetical protein